MVEDEAIILCSVGDELRRAGFNVVEASNADQALALLALDPAIDVLFTDVDMPGSMSGLQLAAVARRKQPAIGVIVTSGKLRPADAMMDVGDKFVPKPYSLDAILKALAASAAQRGTGARLQQASQGG